VWQVVRHVTHGGPGWSWVQGFQRITDGRAAYLALKSHYLGEAYSSRIRAAADNTIDSSYYDGKSRSFTFEKYCEVLKAAFTDIEVSGEEVSETRKVRVLLHGIRDKRLDTAVSQVMATPALRDTFESALNFIARFADEMKSLDTSGRAQQMRNVSAVNIRRGGRGSGRGFASGTRGGGSAGRSGGRAGSNSHKKIKVEDRYYPYEEWKLLDEDQQKQVCAFKAQRDASKKRGANSVETNRNIKPQPEVSEKAGTRPSEIGAVMSNRKPAANRDL
jgi:hypothetical protein